MGPPYDETEQLSRLTSKIGSQLLLASTSSIVLLERGSEKAFNECLGASNEPKQLFVKDIQLANDETFPERILAIQLITSKRKT